MSDPSTLEDLQALHRELVAVSEHRYDNLEALDAALQDHAVQFQKLLDKRPRKAESRTAVESGEHNFPASRGKYRTKGGKGRVGRVHVC